MPYATADELKFELEQKGTLDESTYDDLYETLVEEASGAIDNYCRRNFVVPESATVRFFFPTSGHDELYDIGDVASTADLVVAYDSADDGTYSTVLVNGTDYFLCVDPVTNMVTNIVATGRPGFYASRYRRPSYKVTARFGWPAVPGPVHRACIILARRYFTRKDSAQGVLGFGDMGAVKLSTVDPDVQALLAPYRRLSGLIA